MKKIILTVTFLILVPIFIINSATPDLSIDTMYAYASPNLVISSKILNEGSGSLNCYYSIDEGTNWRKAILEIHYNSKYCKAYGLSSELVKDPSKLKIKVKDSYSNEKITSSVIVYNTLAGTDTGITSENIFYETNSKTYFVPSVFDIKINIINIPAGIKTCKWKLTSGELYTQETVSVTSNSSSTCEVINIKLPDNNYHDIQVTVVDNVESIFTTTLKNLKIDNTKPNSALLQIRQDAENTKMLWIQGHVEDYNGSGIQEVQLWYRKDSGSGYGNWNLATTNTYYRDGIYAASSLFNPEFTLNSESLGGNGKYEFYSLAKDFSKNSEDNKTIQELIFQLVSPVIISSSKSSISSSSKSSSSYSNPKFSSNSYTSIKSQISISQSLSSSENNLTIQEIFEKEWKSFTLNNNLKLTSIKKADNYNVDDKGFAKGITISGTADANSTIQISIFSNKFQITTQADKDGKWEVTLYEGFEIGKHSLYLVQIKDSVNSRTSEVVQFQLLKDNVLISSTLTSESSNSNFTSDFVKNVIIIVFVLLIVTFFIGLIYIFRNRTK